MDCNWISEVLLKASCARAFVRTSGMRIKSIKGEQFALNPAVRRGAMPKGLFAPEEYGKVQSFLNEADRGPATPLITLSALASGLGVGEILLKDESFRWGLSAFKIL